MASWLPRSPAALIGCVLALLLLVYTAQAYSAVSLALVAASLALGLASHWSCRTLFGDHAARVFLVLGVALGWFAEQMGSTQGWFFGHYSYTEVLGPRVGSVPVVIPLMWFGLCHVSYLLACLLLWRQPAVAAPGWKSWVLSALLSSMIVTAFDLGADPYFVYVLKAWIMARTDGRWFGETIKGFQGWMLVSFVIVMLFQVITRPALRRPAAPRARLAALLPLLIYAGMLVFQVCLTQPEALRVIAFFAMGIPTLAACVAWCSWQPDDPAAAIPTVDPAVWDAASLQADPLADRTVATLIGPWSGVAGATGPGIDRLSQATRLMATWSSNSALASFAPAGDGADPAVADALQAYIEQGRILPPWADAAKIERAERVFMDRGPLSCTLLFCASLPQCYVLPHLADVLDTAGQLEAHTEHRIRQTAAMVFPVMMRGGLLSAQGGGVAQVLKVRLIHATIRHLILRGSPEAADGRVDPLPGPAAGGMYQAMATRGWDITRQGQPCSQLELAYTLLTFSYVFLDGLRKLGVGLAQDDEEAYLHAWNVVGHVLGIRQELMAHTMLEAGTLFKYLQARAFATPPARDARPALGRALIQTMAGAIRLPIVRGLPVPLTRWLVGPPAARAIGVDEHVSLPTRLVFAAGRLLVGSVDGLARLFAPDFSLSRLLTRIIGYHLLTRFLLDQTRPLGLPPELLRPMGETVASWHQDPQASAWVNRCEDHFTTTGPWRAVAGGSPGA